MSDKRGKGGVLSRTKRTPWIKWRLFVREYPEFPPIPDRCEGCGAELHGSVFEAPGGAMTCGDDCSRVIA